MPDKLFILGLCLLVFTVYFNALNNDFVLDDVALIVHNPFIKSLKLLPHIFQKHLYENSTVIEKSFNVMYRPLQLLTYAIDYRIWKFNPFGFHLINILLHLCNSILVYYLLLTLFNNKAISKIVSILFLVHPINTSAVSYIAGRADLLACFFMFLSIISFCKFIKGGGKIYYLISLFCSAFALLSRENALILFIFIALTIFVRKLKPRHYLYALPFILLNLAYFLLRFFVFGYSAIATNTNFLSFPLRAVNFFNIILKYILLLIFPLNLHMFRTTPFINPVENAIIFLALALILLFFLIALIRIHKNILLLAGILWFVIGLIPVFIRMDSYYGALNEAMMAESWLYMPSIGFFILFISMLGKFKRLGKVLIIFMVIFYSFLTMVNNICWKNDLILHKNILEYSSGKNYLRLNLINYYINNGLYPDALKEIKQISAYYPDNPHLYFMWGKYYFATEKLDMAIRNYSLAIEKNKNFFFAYYGLSSCYEKLGQFDKAIDIALSCFKINPYYVPNLIKLGNLYAQKKQFSEAKKYYRLASEIEPGNKLLKGKE